MEYQVFLVLAAFAVFWFVVLYNRFVKKKNRLEEAWSGIDVQLKRRANLIPNTGFVQVQGQLNEIEDQIQYARRYYNGAAREWNIMVESFPSNFVANLFNFVQAEFFELDTVADREVPKVSF